MPRPVVDAVGDRVERFPAARDGGCAWAGVVMDTNPPDADHWWHTLAEETRPEGFAFFRQPGGLRETASGRFEPDPAAENLENLPPGYYEETNPAFIYIGDWRFKSKANASGGTAAKANGRDGSASSLWRDA